MTSFSIRVVSRNSPTPAEDPRGFLESDMLAGVGDTVAIQTPDGEVAGEIVAGEVTRAGAVYNVIDGVDCGLLGLVDRQDSRFRAWWFDTHAGTLRGETWERPHTISGGEH